MAWSDPGFIRLLCGHSGRTWLGTGCPASGTAVSEEVQCGLGWAGLTGCSSGAGGWQSQGLWHSPQDAWGWLIPPGVFGAPVLFPGDPAEPVLLSFPEALRGVWPAAQAAVATQTPELPSGQVQNDTAVSPGCSLA